MGSLAAIYGISLAYQWYQDKKNRQLQSDLSQPLPTHLRYAWNPMQRQMYNWMSPYMGGMYGQASVPSAQNLAGQTGIAAFEGGGQAPSQAGSPFGGNPQQRQFGGPVGKQPYVVGEAGPELFVPEQDGYILPSRQAGGPVRRGGQNMPPKPGQTQYNMPPLPPTPGSYGGGRQDIPGMLPAQQMPTAQAWQMGEAGVPTAPTAAPMAQPGTQPTWGGVQAAQAPAPTGGWYGNLDPNVRAGIEEPYQRGMEMLEERMQGRGTLGSQRAGMSGAAADVLGQYMQQAAPSMAMTGWGMMAPGLMEQQRQQYGADVMGAQRPWEAGMATMGQEYGAGMQQAGTQGQMNLAQAQAGWGMSAQQQAAQQQANLMAQGQGWEAQMMPYQMLPQMMPYMMPEAIASAGPITFPGEGGQQGEALPPPEWGGIPPWQQQNMSYAQWQMMHGGAGGPDTGPGPGPTSPAMGSTSYG